MSELPDLTADPAALRVRKRPVPVRIDFATADGTCQTLEGPVRYRRGDAVVTGTRGENWPITRDLALASYEPVPPTAPGEDGLYLKRPALARALRLRRPLAVPVGWQDDPLQGRPGDWLLRYADGSHGIVQDAIFRETYEPAADEPRWPPAD